MKKIESEVEGIVPLIQHNPAGIKDEDAKLQSGKPDYSVEAEQALYRNDKGEIYVPSTWIEGTLRKASSNFKIPGRGKKSYKDLMLSSILIDPDQIPLIHNGYEIDQRPVVINRSRVIRYRPKFNTWKLKFTVNILDEQVGVEALKKILG